MSKVCTKCNQEKPTIDFYKHSQVADGRMGKCKECCKSDVQSNYQKNKQHYVEYERKRCKDPARKKKVAVYQQRLRKRQPEKYKARTAIGNAIRDGRIERGVCACGNPKTQAHHHDYSKPLDVEWLCFKCHREKRHGQSVTE